MAEPALLPEAGGGGEPTGTELLWAHFSPVLHRYESGEDQSSPSFLLAIVSAIKSCPFDSDVHRNWIKCLEKQMEKVTTPLDNIKLIQNCILYIRRAITKFEISRSEQLWFKEWLLSFQLFDMKDVEHEKLYKKIQKDTAQFCENLPTQVYESLTVARLGKVIDGLLLGDGLLLEDKMSELLRNLKNDTNRLSEMCDIIKWNIQNLTDWSTPVDSAIVHSQRKESQGADKAIMIENVCTTLMLHTLAAYWSIHMKEIFTVIYSSGVLKRGKRKHIKSSIEGKRRDFHQKCFHFMLPSNHEDLLRAKKEEFFDENAAESYGGNSENCVLLQQQLLHIISNEAHLSFHQQPGIPFTLVLSGIEFAPGPIPVSDALIITVLEFFGVTRPWTAFFRKFLLQTSSPSHLAECSCEENQQSGSSSVRRRVSTFHAFSTMFEESIFFIMDLYVNLHSGITLYRIRDDIWFWGHNIDTICRAWIAIQSFASFSGLKLKAEKSASVSCYTGARWTVSGPHPLPQGLLTWGFVTFTSDGVFRINREPLMPHILAMRKSLEKCECIETWVETHNRYIQFFSHKFVTPALTLGSQHVHQIRTAMEYIYNEVHREAGGSVMERLCQLFGNKQFGWQLRLYTPFPMLKRLECEYANMEKWGGFPQHCKYMGAPIRQVLEWRACEEKSRQRREERRLRRLAPHDEDEDYDEHGTITLSESDGGETDGDNSKLGRAEGDGERQRKYIDFKEWCKRNTEYNSKAWYSHYCRLLE